MFRAGYAHRDISTGNVLAIGEGDDVSGQLSDFEYCQPIVRHAGPEHREKKTVRR